MKRLLQLTIFLFVYQVKMSGQTDSLKNKLIFNGDFRFRVEQDWATTDQFGFPLEDKTRLRFRFRSGMEYTLKNNLHFGAGIRTGYTQNPQDPQITFGDKGLEFGNLPIGLEKLYAGFNTKHISGWIGKNSFPFERQNELFWSENVFPSGIFLSSRWQLKNGFLNDLNLHAAHFIYSSSGTLFDEQSIDGVQLVSRFFNSKFSFFPGLYYFHKLPSIPGSNLTNQLNYLISHVGAKITLFTQPSIHLEFDYYQNMTSLTKYDFVSDDFKNEKTGFVGGIIFGESKLKGDWAFKIYYVSLEKYAAVDYLAQNDWARWSYSDQNSPAGRLTNFRGYEAMVGYMIAENLSTKVRFFHTEQIVKTGTVNEKSYRIRLDLDFAF